MRLNHRGSGKNHRIFTRSRNVALSALISCLLRLLPLPQTADWSLFPDMSPENLKHSLLSSPALHSHSVSPDALRLPSPAYLMNLFQAFACTWASSRSLNRLSSGIKRQQRTEVDRNLSHLNKDTSHGLCCKCCSTTTPQVGKSYMCMCMCVSRD